MGHKRRLFLWLHFHIFLPFDIQSVCFLLFSLAFSLRLLLFPHLPQPSCKHQLTLTPQQPTPLHSKSLPYHLLRCLTFYCGQKGRQSKAVSSFYGRVWQRREEGIAENLKKCHGRWKLYFLLLGTCFLWWTVYLGRGWLCLIPPCCHLLPSAGLSEHCKTTVKCKLGGHG